MVVATFTPLSNLEDYNGQCMRDPSLTAGIVPVHQVELGMVTAQRVALFPSREARIVTTTVLHKAPPVTLATNAPRQRAYRSAAFAALSANLGRGCFQVFQRSGVGVDDPAPLRAVHLAAADSLPLRIQA